jgi:chromosome segregation ATPase
MKAFKKTAGLAGLVLTAGLLTGCGNDTEAYCNDLQETIDEMGSLTGSDPASLEQAFDEIEKLADSAPEEVEEEWKILDEQMDTIQDALDEAGIEMSDLDGIMTGQLPEGVTEEDLTALGESLQDLNNEEVQRASEKISTHAQEECGIDIEGGTTPEDGGVAPEDGTAPEDEPTE